MMTGHIIGPSGVESKLSGLLKCSHADTAGAMVDWRRRLSLSSVCGRSWSHRKFGGELKIPVRIARKCALKVWMALSAALHRWKFGGENWNFQPQFSSMISLWVSLASLSRILGQLFGRSF